MRIPSLARLVLLIGLALVVGPVTAHAATTASLDSCSAAYETISKPDGSTIVLGNTWQCQSEDARSGLVLELRPDGSLNPSFSDGGIRLLGESQLPVGAELTADGKLLLATSDRLYRLMEDGSDDPSFGDQGVVTGVDQLLKETPSVSMRTDSQGRIVVLGVHRYKEVTADLLARFGPDGQLDQTFGDEGVAVYPPAVDGDFHGAYSMTIDGMNRVLLLVSHWYDQSVARLAEDGSPDLSFGPDGNGIAPIPKQGTGTGISLAADGAIQVTEVTPTGIYCPGNYLSVLDPEGIPLPARSYEFGCGYSEMLPIGEGRNAYTVDYWRPGPEIYGLGVRTRPDQYWQQLFPVSPGVSETRGIEYDPDADQIVGSGYADGGDCAAPDCEIRRHIVISRSDAVTGQPDDDFGTGGAVMLPLNSCRYGEAGAAGTPRLWRRCRVKPPTFAASARISRGRRPALNARVALLHPPTHPVAMTQRVALRLPAGLRLRRMTARSIVARAVTKAKGRLTKAVRGRSVVVTFIPYVDTSNPVDPTGLTNYPLRLRIRIPRGHLVRPHARGGPRPAHIRVVSAPHRIISKRWYAPNSRSRSLALRR
ncbi:MAG: hypothetical protein J0H98_10965 [Solirubrobacterales bacterium]|nr:hypothetical protein [Solirubrobacterales bacterium]